MSEHWNFRRFVRESRAYIPNMSWYRFYPAAVKRWPGFNRQQKRDEMNRS